MLAVVLGAVGLPGDQQGTQDVLMAQSAQGAQETFDEPSVRDMFRQAFEEPPLREPNEEQFANVTHELLITGHAVWKLKPLHGQAEKFCKTHQRQPSWSECREAVAQAVRSEMGTKLEHQGLKTVSDGSDRPKGCFFDHVHQTAMYNTHHSGGSDTKLHRPICGDPICSNSLCGGTGACHSSCGVKKSLFPLRSAPGKSMPYYHSEHSTPFTEEPQPGVRLGLIVMHGAQRDGADYLCRLQNSITKHLGSVKLATEQTVLIAPQIALSRHHDEWPYKPIYDSHLSWGRTNMVGMDDQETILSWSAGANSSGVPSTSLYDVFDELVEAMTNRTMYPNLEKVLVVGHSKGASVVLRYAMTTTVIRRIPVPIGFHAANPSALVYSSSDRPVPPEHYSCGYRDSKHIASKKWVFKPLAESKYAVDAFGTCSQADKWPYGLSGQFPDYVTRNWPGGKEGIDNMREAFLRKHVNVYSGDADTCNARVHEALKCYPRSCKMNDCDMETSCAAMYQGVNRMSRIRAYMQQPEIRQSGHKLISVTKSGHNSCIMFQSKIMRDILFDKLLTDEPYTNDAAAAGAESSSAANRESGNKLEKHEEGSPSLSSSSGDILSSSGDTMSSGETWSASSSNTVSLASSTAPAIAPVDDHPSDAFAAAAFMAASASEGIGAAARKAIAAAAARPASSA